MGYIGVWAFLSMFVNLLDEIMVQSKKAPFHKFVKYCNIAPSALCGCTVFNDASAYTHKYFICHILNLFSSLVNVMYPKTLISKI